MSIQVIDDKPVSVVGSLLDQATDGWLNWISIRECPDELLQLQVHSKSNGRWELLTVLVTRWLSMKNDLFEEDRSAPS